VRRPHEPDARRVGDDARDPELAAHERHQVIGERDPWRPDDRAAVDDDGDVLEDEASEDRAAQPADPHLGADRVHDFFPDLAPRNSLLSGLGFGVDLNTTDDLLDPHRGWAASLGVEPVGGFLGGDFTFVRLLVEARRYQPLPADFTLALRTRVGFADPYAGTKDVPLFERFYAGGIDSVRGYERRHVGPMVEGDPIGGLSLVEGSIELRHPITDTISGAVFFDAGQVSRERFHLPVDELRYGAGVGAGYKTPVGPLRVDLGFPFDAPHGDASWQIHVSIGQAF
jgi:outer membrane translocation and assembly module TamA